jgi:hypothetical protein
MRRHHIVGVGRPSVTAYVRGQETRAQRWTRAQLETRAQQRPAHNSDPRTTVFDFATER